MGVVQRMVGVGGGVPPLSTVSLETAGIRVATLPSAPDTHTLLRLQGVPPPQQRTKGRPLRMSETRLTGMKTLVASMVGLR